MDSTHFSTLCTFLFSISLNVIWDVRQFNHIILTLECQKEKKENNQTDTLKYEVAIINVHMPLTFSGVSFLDTRDAVDTS